MATVARGADKMEFYINGIEEAIRDALVKQLRAATGHPGLSASLVRVYATDEVVDIRIHNSKMYDSMDVAAALSEVTWEEGEYTHSRFECSPQTVLKNVEGKAFATRLQRAVQSQQGWGQGKAG
jgi:hypothetical protein